MANDLDVVYKIGADITGLKTGVEQAAKTAQGLEASASKIGVAFEAGFKNATRGVGTVTADLLLAQKHVTDLQKLLLKNADKPGFIAGIGYELDAAIPRVAALQHELGGLTKDLTGLGDGVKQVSTSGGGFNSWLGSANSLLATFGLSLSVGALVAFGKHLLDTAGKIEDLHQATGVSREGLQRLAYVGDEVGVGMDEIGRAVGTLSDRLASGDASAVRAVQLLGLNINDLMAAGPEEAFLQIAEAAGRVEDPMTKNAIAADLFGGKLGKVLIPMLGDLRQKLLDVPKDAIIKDQDIINADKFGDAVGHFTTKLEAWAFLVGSAAFKTAVETWRLMNLQHVGSSQLAADLFVGPDLPTPTKGDGGHDIELVADATKHLTTQSELLQNRLKALRADAMLPLSAAQKQQILELQAWGESEQEIAKLVGTSVSAVHRYSEAHKESASAVAAAAKKSATATKAVMDAQESYGAILASVDQMTRLAILHDKDLGVSETDLATFYKLTTAQIKAVIESREIDNKLTGLSTTATIANSEAFNNLGRNIDNITIPALLDLLATRQKLMRDVEGKNKIGSVDVGSLPLDVETVGRLKGGFDKADEARKQFHQGLRDLSQSFANLAQISGDSFGGILKAVGELTGGIDLAVTATENFQLAQADANAKTTRKLATTIAMYTTYYGLIVASVDYLNKATGLQKNKDAAEFLIGNPQRIQAFIAAMGGEQAILEKTGLTAQEVGEYLRRAMSTKSAKDFTAALQPLIDRLDVAGESASRLADILSEASSKFGPSGNDLKEAEQHAHELFDAMVKDGTFTADQIKKAYFAWQESMANAGDAMAEQWVRNMATAGDAMAQAWVKAKDGATEAGKAASAAMSAAEKELTDLIAKRDSLAAGIAAEAPEQVMGVIEGQQRGQLAALDDEIARKAAQYQDLARTSGQQMADEIVKALSRIEIHLPVIWDIPDFPHTPGERPEPVPGFATGGIMRLGAVQHFATGGLVGPDKYPALLSEGEMVLTKGQQRAVTQSQSGSLTVQVTINADIIHDPGDLENRLTDAVLRGVEKGGTRYKKFRRLSGAPA